MDHMQFYNSFAFRTLCYQGQRHTDNSAGIACHFLARMRCGSGRIVPLYGEPLQLSAGDVFYLPRGLRYHSYWYGDPAADGRVEWESHRFDLLPTKEDTLALQTVTASADVHALLDRLAAEGDVTARSVGLLYLVMGELMPLMKRQTLSQGAAFAASVRAYIEAHPDFRVAELARHCGMSESGLYACFRRELGTTPLGLRNRIKVERATVLLEETDLSVEEIAERLGFGNAACFRKIVKEVTGKTPSAIRKAAHVI
ncbi:MAG: helix-turn-helix domain-containing protein [Ruminococcaceae bacterium]|nr:helix-turn-helix domain-containing protein [Oscillospiraceae bacterium]